MSLESNEVPSHVALIPDGMRRWAIENEKSLDFAYLLVFSKIKEVVDNIFERGTLSISSYALSTDNLNRDIESLSTTMNATKFIFHKMYEDIALKWSCKFKYAGNLQNVKDKDYVAALLNLCNKSEHFTMRTIYLCVSYDPIFEITQAFDKSRFESKPFFDCLQVNSHIDLLIRTGKENRLSNFLPIQSGYAEIFFIDKFFLDIEINDIDDAYEFYKSKVRRFGR